MAAVLDHDPPANTEALLLWVPRPLKRELRRRARRLDLLERDVATALLQRALTEKRTPATDQLAGARVSRRRSAHDDEGSREV